MHLFYDYTENGRLSDVIKEELTNKVIKFRQMLRKAYKKLRKGSSSVHPSVSNYYDTDYEEDGEVVVQYLEMINDFIK